LAANGSNYFALGVNSKHFKLLPSTTTIGSYTTIAFVDDLKSVLTFYLALLTPELLTHIMNRSVLTYHKY